jgi:hypothetical protein
MTRLSKLENSHTRVKMGGIGKHLHLYFITSDYKQSFCLWGMLAECYYVSEQ